MRLVGRHSYRTEDCKTLKIAHYTSAGIDNFSYLMPSMIEAAANHRKQVVTKQPLLQRDTKIAFIKCQ